MEKTKRAAVLPVSFGWSDVGSWETIWQLASKDAAGNAIAGKAAALDSRGSYVFSEKSQVALLGVEDLVVVATDDAILVARRGSVDGMKQLVDHLRDVAPHVIKDHINVHRPWGSYRSLDNGSRYQVKRIVVKPHGRLSLQMHHHRAEHWIVVRGTALVTVGANSGSCMRTNRPSFPSARSTPGKSGQDRSRIDRGAERQLSRRRRHRAV